MITRLEALLKLLVGGRLQLILIISFTLMTAFTVLFGSGITSHVISQYLSAAESERVSRDMDLANAFYNLNLDEIAAISYRLVLDKWVVNNLPLAIKGNSRALEIIDQQITNKITVLALGGTHLIAVLDEEGNIVAGRTLSSNGEMSPILKSGYWGDLPIVKEAMRTGKSISATDVIPVEQLATVGLDTQAKIELVDTPLAVEKPFDAREGEAGLALVGVAPIKGGDGKILGSALAMYLFNNDFTLVDRIKQVAGVDTVTIFFGDLRVSTNVMTKEGLRAIGTRLSEEVFNVVLRDKQDYIGEAFVVNDTFITSYKPLLNFKDEVIGIIYVGARKSGYQALLDNFRQQVVLIAFLTIALAAIIAIPIARYITRPIISLVDANRMLAKGDMTVRVSEDGSGELAVLEHSFNSMVETLHRTQQELMHKENLASMGQLAAGVAHELNNPLGTILLFSDILLKETPQDDPKREDLQLIIQEATRCKAIVADLLNFARQQDVLSKDTDLHDLIERVIKSLRLKPDFEGIEIKRDYDPDLPTIQADPDQLKQVFINLLDNAAEAVEGCGLIEIITRVVDPAWVEIKISDTGCGIPKENMKKLFTPFFTTKPPGKGTGLGLSIVYGIIKMHRGQISAESKANEGTTFTITLPVRPQKHDFRIAKRNSRIDQLAN